MGGNLLLAPLVLVTSLLAGVDCASQYNSNYNYPPYYTNQFPSYSSNYFPSYSSSYSHRAVWARELFKHGRSISDIQVACSAHTCGVGAQCIQGTVRPVCACKPGYSGHPLVQCIKIECVEDSECPRHQSCVNQHCVNPCKDKCGLNANCDVQYHRAICTCPPGYTGKPEFSCRIADPEEACHPSPCGVNAKCFVSNNQAACACFPGYITGPDSMCRRECETDQECSPQLACRDFKCINPCKLCGKNANCETVAAHHAVCKCPKGYHGDPYSSCSPECTTDGDCPNQKPRCVYNACVNPCTNQCGVNADCNLRGLTPVCSCPRNMTGDPKIFCRPFEPRDQCEPNPCGDYSTCTPGTDRPSCKCIPGYYGIETTGSCERGECELDSQCEDHLACVGFQCLDPCLSNTECGSGGVCKGQRHIAVCTCPQGRNGDALVNCYDTRTSAASTRFIRYKRHGEHDSKKATTKTSEEKVESPEPNINGTAAKRSEVEPTSA